MTNPATLEVRAPSASGRTHHSWSRVLGRVAVWIAGIAICTGLFIVGDILRQRAWEQTRAIRFTADVSNGYNWGSVAVDSGLLNVYRNVTRDFTGDESPDYRVDYTPLRLTVMSVWARWTRTHFDDARSWRDDYAFNRPMLLLNTVCEAVAALGVFWVILLIQKRATGPLRWPAYVTATIGGLLVWFNPAVIFNDCWPQWDAWILPAFVLALVFAVRDCWMIAGSCLAVGAMLKGQILLVTPVFILWPLFAGMFGPLARLVCGYLVAFTLIASPWMLTGKWDLVWTATGAVLAIFALAFRRGWRKPAMRCVAAIALSAGAWIAPLRGSGDMSWFRIGFDYGSRKFMHMGEPGTSNLAMILHESWQWSIAGPDGTFTLPLSWLHLHDIDVTMRQFLSGLYILTLLLSGIAAAMQWRRRDARFLVAMYVPWLLFFALLPQLNNRYLYWGAALIGLLVPAGTGLTLLGILLSFACFAMMAEVMCRFSPGNWPMLESITHGLYPGMGYAVILAAFMVLYVAMSPRRATKPAR